MRAWRRAPRPRRPRVRIHERSAVDGPGRRQHSGRLRRQRDRPRPPSWSLHVKVPVVDTVEAIEVRQRKNTETLAAATETERARENAEREKHKLEHQRLVTLQAVNSAEGNAKRLEADAEARRGVPGGDRSDRRSRRDSPRHRVALVAVRGTWTSCGRSAGTASCRRPCWLKARGRPCRCPRNRGDATDEGAMRRRRMAVQEDLFPLDGPAVSMSTEQRGIRSTGSAR